MRTVFGTAVKVKLVTTGRTNAWLCSEVARRTGKYFDDSYLSKICRGKNNSPTMINAIKEILDIKEIG